MSEKYIPIIGEISAGKSNFLNAFLGIDLLQTGAIVTTKFVCLIKNSSSTSFYHVIPSRKNGELIFKKDGPEAKDSNEIKKKIEETNKLLKQKKGTKNDIFYCLEAPIKNEHISELKEKYIFMDIPGLNEDESNYFDEIFTLFTLKDIFFEIIICDAEKVNPQNINDIFKKLESLKCLKKENNLYILNKIDKVQNKEGIVEKFQQVFYKLFQDDKNQINIEINIYRNQFLPFNSLLYKAEINFNQDFYYFLLVFLFLYVEDNTKEESFIDFIGEKFGVVMKQNNITEDFIDEKKENLSDEDLKIIKESIYKLRDIIPQVKQESGFSLGIPVEDDDESLLNDEIKKAYIFYQNKLYKNFKYSEYYKNLPKKVNEIIQNHSDLGCPPISPQNPKQNNKDDDILNEITIFLKDKLKNQFEHTSKEFQILKENIYGKKIRITFIGNISSGKSTVLNCIIGENLLPIKEEECTYRGIIIKHKDINNYLLYKTEKIIIGKDTGGSKRYHNFIEKGEPYCVGIENINSYLKTKNSDKDIKSTDAFLIIQGRLKIFDFIKLDNKLINSIEFIDLPGLNNNIDNDFIKQGFYKEIMEFSNSCLYVNEPGSYQDGNNVTQILTNIDNDINHLSLKIRNEFFNTCLFLINKSDLIPKEEHRKEIQNYLTQRIKNRFNKYSINNINFSFFSGKFFFQYLDNYKTYVELLELEPLVILYNLFEEYSNSWFSFDFKKFIIKKIDKIGDQMKIKMNIKLDVPKNFKDKIAQAFLQLNKAYGFKVIKDDTEVIKKLYSLYYQIKYNDFSKTNYSRLFFNNLKDIIIKIDELQRKNFKETVKDFFNFLDDLFLRKISVENEQQLAENKNRYLLLKDNIVPKIDILLLNKTNKLKEIIKKAKEASIELIDEEINNAKERLSAADNDLEKAIETLEGKIKNKVNEMKTNCENEVKTIGEEIEKETNETINAYYNSKDMSSSKIETEKAKSKNMIISLISGTLGGVASGLGLYAGGAAIAGGVVAGTVSATAITSFIGSFFGPIGLIGGLVIGGAIVGLVSYFRKTSKYKEALEQTKSKIESSFKNNEECIIKDFEIFSQDLKIDLDKKIEILHKKIEFDREEWEQIKKEYYLMKDKIIKKLESVKF